MIDTVPKAALLLTERVSVLDEDALAGLNDTLTPLGTPEAARLTLLEKPLAGMILTVAVPLPPGCTLTPPGASERAKLGGGG